MKIIQVIPQLRPAGAEHMCALLSELLRLDKRPGSDWTGIYSGDCINYFAGSVRISFTRTSMCRAMWCPLQDLSVVVS